MPIYSPGEPKLVEFVNEVMQRYHPRLAEVELLVDVLEVRPKTDDNGEPLGDALTLHGYPCLATIKNRGPKDRGEGRGDVLLSIDAYRWPEMSEAEQAALIDHELTHVELSVNERGVVKRDDYDRPRTRMRLHDHQYGWFDEVARRHGAASVEVQQATRWRDEFGQYYLPGFDPDPQQSFTDEVADAMESAGVPVVRKGGRRKR